MLIAQLSDLHVRPVGLLSNHVSDTNSLTERALRAVAALHPAPDVVLITGDLTECGLPAEYDNFTSILNRALPRPVYVIPGNHDHRDNFRTALAHLPGVVSDPDYVQYAIEDLPARIVMLDTLVLGRNHGFLSDGQLDWLDRTLAAQPAKPTLIGMHHPPFPVGSKGLDAIALANPGPFQAVIARHPQVRRIVCGHHHRPVIGQCAQAVASVAPSVAHQVELSFAPDHPGALTFEPPAFHLHLFDAETGFISHTIYTQVYPGPFPFIIRPETANKKSK
jgi:3',5'-cyclic AMP phosphodiesterase CpdA